MLCSVFHSMYIPSSSHSSRGFWGLSRHRGSIQEVVFVLWLNRKYTKVKTTWRWQTQYFTPTLDTKHSLEGHVCEKLKVDSDSLLYLLKIFSKSLISHWLKHYIEHCMENCIDTPVLDDSLYKVDLSILGVGHLPVVRQRSQRVLWGRMAQVRVCLLCALRGGRW